MSAPVHGARSRPSVRLVVGGLLVAAGGLVLVASSFLPWFAVDLRGQGVLLVNGWKTVAGDVTSGPLIAGAGFVLTLLGALVVAGARLPRQALVLVVSLLAAGVVIAELVELASPSPGQTTTWAIGAVGLIVGALSAIVGSLLCLGRSENATEASPVTASGPPAQPVVGPPMAPPPPSDPGSWPPVLS
jgi:hypothetical protein